MKVKIIHKLVGEEVILWFHNLPAYGDILKDQISDSPSWKYHWRRNVLSMMKAFDISRKVVISEISRKIVVLTSQLSTLKTPEDIRFPENARGRNCDVLEQDSN